MQPPQGEAFGHGGQLISPADTGGAEACLEQPAYGGHGRGTAGHEYGIHILGRHSGVRQESIDATGDGHEIFIVGGAIR